MISSRKNFASAISGGLVMDVCIVNRDVLFEYHRAVVPFVEQLDQLEVCLPYSRLLTGIPILAVFQNLRWNSNKTSLLTCESSLVQ